MVQAIKNIPEVLQKKKSMNQMTMALIFYDLNSVLKTRENLPVALRATYPENQVALTKRK